MLASRNWQPKSRSTVSLLLGTLIVLCLSLIASVQADHGQDPDLPIKRVLRERMAAWDKTLVAIDEQTPNAILLTYMHNAYVDFNELVKLVPGLVDEGTQRWSPAATGTAVEDFPGGIRAEFRLGSSLVKTEFVPLLIGRGRTEAEGIAVYKIHTDPPRPVVIKAGSGGSVSLLRGPVAHLRSAAVEPFPGGVQLKNGVAFVRSGKEKFPVAIRTDGEISVVGNAPDQQTLLIRLESGTGYVLLAHSDQMKRTAQLIESDPKPLRAKVDAYYESLLTTCIETPEPIIDNAFRTALHNLEYNWIPPYGWVECCHHWMWMFHMQATAGAEWIGQTDRSRACTLTHAENLMPSGAVPQLSPYKQIHRSFGGSNQFWAWQVRHYWQFTADRDFAAQVAPAFDRVLAQTYEEHDRNGNLLLTWGKQIGNQEDFIATPWDGTTPTIEGINMMLTRAELARGLSSDASNDASSDAIAARWEGRARRAASQLRRDLWMPDLGRYAFFVDPEGHRRLEGQYHTFLYPLIWNIVDMFDGYTTLRHVRDRLTDPDGEVYCSNNFPNHIIGTWGMQGGAAQQPWAAWGLAAMGLRNEAYRPLKAVAQWVFDENHRGSWPEVSKESPPAYFTPPAGLFLAAVTEALFGLKMNAPQGEIEISPSFPDHWPTAKLSFPDYKVAYAHKDNELSYRLETKQPLARKVRWKLPLTHIDSVKVDGQPMPYSVNPGVGYIVLHVDIPASRATTIAITTRPIHFSIQCPSSVAEGDSFTVKAEGLKLVSVKDRHGVLSEFEQTGDDSIRVRVRSDLLAPYAKHGRLGQLNFSRRTFFIKCQSTSFKEDGVASSSIFFPIDLAILPPCEVAPDKDVTCEKDGLRVALLVRNNRESSMQGQAWLHVVQHDFAFDVDIPGRTQETITVTIPTDLATLFSVGDNRATVTLPAGTQVDVKLTAASMFRGETPLAQYARSRVATIPIPGGLTVPDTDWLKMRKGRFYSATPWPAWRHPMLGIADQTELSVEELPGVSFEFAQRKFIPINSKISQPKVRIDLKSESYRKLYLLLFSFLDNHDIFADVGQVSVTSGGETIFFKTLSFPGDLDWWDNCWPHNAQANSTARQTRKNRHGLLPLLGHGDGDWKEGTAPGFPQPEFWATSVVVRTETSNLNVVEIDLGRYIPVETLEFKSIGVDPAFGLVAITGETPGDTTLLAKTDWMPPIRFRSPRELFLFNDVDELHGWRLEGDAFRVAASPPLFTFPTLNSLSKSGEQATGRAVSPDFTLPQDEGAHLEIEFHGGTSRKVAGKENLCVRVVDAKSGEVLKEIVPAGSHQLSKGLVPLDGLTGRTIRLELIDNNRESGFAWIGLHRVRISYR